MSERFVVLGVARARTPWFAEVARWCTNGTLPAHFVKCVSVEEVRARLGSGRRYSALIVDAGLPQFDRDLVASAAGHDCPVVAVSHAHSPLDVDELGLAGRLPVDFGRADLLTLLTQCAALVPDTRSLPCDPRTESSATPAPWMGKLVAVCGTGGTGVSTVAIATAQTLGRDPRHGGLVALVDLALDADQAVLHGTDDVVPGLPELVDANRRGTPDATSVLNLTFDVPDRRYRLLLGLRRHRDWSALRPAAVRSTLVSLRRSFQVVIADVDADVEGERECGAVEVEDRNLLARPPSSSPTSCWSWRLRGSRVCTAWFGRSPRSRGTVSIPPGSCRLSTAPPTRRRQGRTSAGSRRARPRPGVSTDLPPRAIRHRPGPPRCRPAAWRTLRAPRRRRPPRARPPDPRRCGARSTRTGPGRHRLVVRAGRGLLVTATEATASPLLALEADVQSRAKDLSLDMADPAATERLEALVDDAIKAWSDAHRRGHRPFDLLDPNGIADRVIRNLAGYGPLAPLLEDPDVWEIMVNAPDEVFVKRHRGPSGYHDEAFHDDDHVTRTLTKILDDAGGSHRKFDPSEGLQDAQLLDGSRLHIVHRELSRGGHVLVNIRKFTGVAIRSLADLVGRGTLDDAAATLLRACVQARTSIVFAGAPGAGKTTLLVVLRSRARPGVAGRDRRRGARAGPPASQRRAAPDPTWPSRAPRDRPPPAGGRVPAHGARRGHRRRGARTRGVAPPADPLIRREGLHHGARRLGSTGALEIALRVPALRQLVALGRAHGTGG